MGGTPQNVSINNDDVATITVTASPAPVAEDSGAPITITFTATAASPTATNLVISPPRRKQPIHDDLRQPSGA